MNEPVTTRQVFLKLLRRPAAAVALCVIALTCVTALLAYRLAPDSTPHANTMILELAARPPGFSTQVLRIPTRTQPAGGSWFTGRPAQGRLIPLDGYYFEGDSLAAVHYVDEQIRDTIYFPLLQLLGPAAPQTREEQQEAAARLTATYTTILGTDRYGRDILSRLLVGARVSISVGLVAVILSLSIGIVLGALAGYFGGVTDNIIMWLIHILWAIPTLLLVFAITLTLGKGFWELFIAIGLTMWVGAARLVRGQVLALREAEFVTAARAMGQSDLKIIFRHILPHVAGPLMVIAASNFAAAILIEAGLSFLGIGVQPPQPSWGLMIKEHYNFLLTNQPLPALIPGMAIMLLVFAFYILGNSLRDVLDVKDR